MMKTQLTAILIVIGLLAGHQQAKAATEERNVPAFTEISLRISAKVYLSQGEKQSIEIVAKESALEKIVTEVKGRELVIRKSTSNPFKSDFDMGKVEIFITVPEITKLSSSGSGHIAGDGAIEARIMDISVNGSGNVNLDDFQSERVTATISGSGSVKLAGKKEAVDLSVTISGSGDFKGPDFKAQDVTVKLSGSGNVVVHALSSLKVRSSGSGNVAYKGKPLVDQAISGSGRVKAMQ